MVQVEDHPDLPIVVQSFAGFDPTADSPTPVSTVLLMEIHADALLFDNDGVLVDSHDHVERAWTMLADEFGLDTAELLRVAIGVPAMDTIQRYVRGPDVDRVVARLEDIEVELAEDLVAIPGAVELLAQLPEGLWAIVTSASTRLAEARWRGAGIPVPPNAVTADDVSAGKPNPLPYLTAAAKLGVDPQRAVIFEDSVAGSAAAHAAGATVIAVGDQPWPEPPAARIADLTRVSVSANGSALRVVVSQ